MQRPWGGMCLKVWGGSKVKLQRSDLTGGSDSSLCAGLRWMF